MTQKLTTTFNSSVKKMMLFTTEDLLVLGDVIFEDYAKDEDKSLFFTELRIVSDILMKDLYINAEISEDIIHHFIEDFEGELTQEDNGGRLYYVRKWRQNTFPWERREEIDTNQGKFIFNNMLDVQEDCVKNLCDVYFVDKDYNTYQVQEIEKEISSYDNLTHDFCKQLVDEFLLKNSKE